MPKEEDSSDEEWRAGFMHSNTARRSQYVEQAVNGARGGDGST